MKKIFFVFASYGIPYDFIEKGINNYENFVKNQNFCSSRMVLVKGEFLGTKILKGVTEIATKKTYNTPHRGCVVKTRLTEEERQDFEEKCRTFSISQSEYLRQAIFYGKVSTTIKVTANNEEMLTAVSGLVAQYGKIGSNLNQIARHLNEYSLPYRELAVELNGYATELAALKYEVLKVIGEAYGNDKTYQL